MATHAEFTAWGVAVLLALAAAPEEAPTANPKEMDGLETLVGQDGAEPALELLVRPTKSAYEPGEKTEVFVSITNNGPEEFELPNIDWQFAYYLEKPGGYMEPVAKGMAKVYLTKSVIVKPYGQIPLLNRPIGWSPRLDDGFPRLGDYRFVASLQGLHGVHGETSFQVVRDGSGQPSLPAAEQLEFDFKTWRDDPWWGGGDSPHTDDLEEEPHTLTTSAGYGFFRENGGFNPGVRWYAMPQNWEYNGTNRPSNLPAQNVFDTIDAAWKTWNNDPGAFFRFNFRGNVTDGASGNNNDSRNIFDWCNDCLPSSDAIATTFIWTAATDSRRIIETDIVMENNHAWSLDADFDPGTTFDVQTIALHEIGHTVSLTDLYNPCSANPCSSTPCYTGTIYDWMGSGNQIQVMCGKAPQVNKRTLVWGDKAGLRYVYPERFVAATGIGASTTDAGADVALINSGNVPDLIVAWMDDPGAGDDVWYRIGWNLSASSGQAGAWSGILEGPQNIADSTQGLGVASGWSIDSNSRPELLFFWVDDPLLENSIKYVIYYNVDANGNPASQSAVKTIGGGGGIGWSSQGLGACMRPIDSDTVPDVVVAWADNPNGQNTIKYRVGFDIDSNGDAASWTDTKTIGNGAIGELTNGVGVACTNVNEVGSPDIIFGWVDDLINVPANDRLYYRIGFNFDGNGDAAGGWLHREAFGNDSVGPTTRGFGLGYGQIDTTFPGESYFAYVNDPGSSNEVKYRVDWDVRYNSHK